MSFHLHFNQWWLNIADNYISTGTWAVVVNILMHIYIYWCDFQNWMLGSQRLPISKETKFMIKLDFQMINLGSCMTSWFWQLVQALPSMIQFYDLDKYRYLFSIISLGCASISPLKHLAITWLVTHSSHNENHDPLQEDNHYASYRGHEPASHGGMIGLTREMTGIISLWSLSQIHDHLYIGGIYPTRGGPSPT